ncbi:F1 complex, OSCP/delta subunit of ATPase, partial [Caulochytrium protostelioides]
KDAGVATFLASPLSDRAQKNAGIDAILAQGRFSETTGHFLRLLADNRRLNATEGIIASFTEIMAAHRGEVSVTVTSATKLDNKAMTNLKNSIAKSALASGKKLIVDNVVDPAVLGGVVVTIGDRTIDLSVASRLAKLNRAVAEPI